MRSFFVLVPNAFEPGNFRWTSTPELLAYNEVWSLSSSVASGLLMRVRSEQAPGSALAAGDRIESVIGLVDSTTRWRAVASLTRIALGALRSPGMAEACGAIFGLIVNKHPASVMSVEKQALAARLHEAAERLPAQNAQAAHELAVGNLMFRLLGASDDLEAFAALDGSGIGFTNVDPDNKEAVAAREGTIEIMASSVLTGEAAIRLAEKIPSWLWSPMPEVPKPAVAASPAPPEGREDSEHDED